MEKIFTNKISKAKLERHSEQRVKAGANPKLSWCKLVDSSIHCSGGISLGCLFIPVGGELPRHTHLPQEIYFIKSGTAELLKEDNKIEIVNESDVVYIPKGVKHGLKNRGNKILEIIWIFPTDSWDDVEYNYIDNKI